MELAPNRTVVLVINALFALHLVACARAGIPDAGTLDVGARPDVLGVDVSVRPDTGTDARTSDGGAPMDTPRDTRGTDARGADAPGADAPRTDAPLDGGRSSCRTDVDISAGGTFSIDTCALTDGAVAACGALGSPDAILAGAAPPSGSTYSITVPAGWAIQQLRTGCDASFFDCSLTGFWSVSGATPEPTWFFGISRADGSCGPVDVVVERLM